VQHGIGVIQATGYEIWNNSVEKVLGVLDAAQLLAPLPIATTLGVGGIRADVISGLALSLNGNAITLSQALAGPLADFGGAPTAGARATAQALARYLQQGGGQITLASAHTFSCHTLQLRQWLRAGGLDPDRDVRIIILPPEQMVDSLARGIIDGFCVGEPWNSMAVQHGIGVIQATGYEIWNNSVEKVLGVLESWHQNHPGSHLRLRLALMEACTWLSHPFNREQTVSVLADPAYLDLPEDVLRPSITGQLVFSKGGQAQDMPHFHVFGRFQAGFPWRSDGIHMAEHIGESLGKNFSEADIKSLVQRTLRTDLYREAARQLDMPSPNQDYKPLNRHAHAWEIEPGIELGPDLMLTP